MFTKRESIAQVELGDAFAPRFGEDGLLPAIVIDDATGDTLMLGYMTAEALRLTIDTGDAHYWSRSRQALWRKGEHSGFVHRVAAILVDDDQDALLLRVRLAGPGSCHVGYRSCFYRELRQDADGAHRLSFIETVPAFDAEAVYAGFPNPTRL